MHSVNRSRIGAAAFGLWLLVSVSGCAHFTPAGLRRADRAHWRRLENAHLRLTTSLDDVKAAEAFRALEDDITIVRAALGAHGLGKQVEVVVFGSNSEFDSLYSFTHGEALVSTPSEQPENPTLLLHGDVSQWLTPDQHSSKKTSSIARHELTHVISRQAYPVQSLWFGEGLAGYFEPIVRDADPTQVVLGEIHPEYFPALRLAAKQGRLMPVAQLIRGDDWLDARFYPTAWLFVHYLANAQPTVFEAFLSECRDGRYDEAVVHLQASLRMERIDQDLAAYLKEGRFYPTRRRVEAMLEPTVVPLSEVSWGLLRLRLLAIAKDVPGALAAANDVLSLDPTSETTRRFMVTQSDSRDLQAFVGEWLQAVPNSVAAWVLKGALSDDPAVQAEAQRRQAEAPLDWRVLDMLALALVRHERPAAAHALVQQHARDSRMLGPTLEIDALALARLNQWDDAIAAQRAAIEWAKRAGFPADEASLTKMLKHEQPGQ